MWTVGLNVERKLRLQISPAWCRRYLNDFFMFSDDLVDVVVVSYQYIDIYFLQSYKFQQ